MHWENAVSWPCNTQLLQKVSVEDVSKQEPGISTLGRADPRYAHLVLAQLAVLTLSASKSLGHRCGLLASKKES